MTPPLTRSSALAALVLLPIMAGAQPLHHTLVSPDLDQNGAFSEAVAGVPDVDGDGVDDLLVGARLEGSDDRGAAYVYSGATGAPLYALASPYAGYQSWFGFAVAGVPDLDGDGRGDLLISAPAESHAAQNDGRAYVFSGATGTLLHTLTSPNPGDGGGSFGEAVGGLGDVDGDGRGDLLIGAPGEDAGGVYRPGRAYVFSGATGAPLHTLNSPNSQEIGAFGRAVAGVPDLDGDGADDLLVGASKEDALASNDGRAYVFSGATGALLRTLTSPNAEEGGIFGDAVSGVPDADGDGVSDLLVGARLEGHGTSPDAAGRAYVFSGATGALLHTLASPNEIDAGNFGFAVAGVPDLDGDGRGDLLVGAPVEGPRPGSLFNRAYGRAYVFSGSTGTLIRTLASPARGESCEDLFFDACDAFGRAVAGLHDVDGDGRGDIFAGAPGEDPEGDDEGRAYVFSSRLPLALSAEVLNSPVARGGRLRVRVTLTNHTDAPITADYVLDADGPAGLASRTRLASGAVLQAGQAVSRTVALRVPPGVLLGHYIASLTAYEGGTAHLAVATFAFDVAASGALAAREAPGAADADGAEWSVEVLDGDAIAAEAEAGAPAAEATVWPNPATDRATVAFTLDTPAPVRLALYDVLGREVAAVAAGRLEAGAHRLPLDASALPGGVYVWRLAAGDHVEGGRLTVAR